MLLIVLSAASAAAWLRYARILKSAQSNLEEAEKYIREKEAENEQATGIKDADIERRLPPVLRDIESLKARLAGIDAQQAIQWVPPGTDNEIVNRFRGLGYEVGVVRPK